LVPLNQHIRGKGGKWALECSEVDKIPKIRKEEINQKEVDKTSKEFFALFNTFQTLVVQQGKITSQNNETMRLMG
jgi:hypothetical protein